jgi:hypothetical protein
MEAGNFDRTLRGLARRTPFQPFTVELNNGARVEVDHPEALVFRAGLAVFVDAEGQPSLFDRQSVSRLVGSHGQSVDA